LAKFEADFTKRFGEGTIRTWRKYQVVSTGSLTLDYAMGCGGYVVGRIAEIWGVESVAKTTLAVIAARNFQKRFPDRIVGWIDMERTFDVDWAKKHGLDMKLIRVLLPKNSEDVSNMARDLIKTGLVSLVVLDSVGGMVTEEEMSKEADKASVGTAAKVITRMVKMAAVLCDETDTTMIIVNQTRANLGYGGDTTTGGGFALKHVSTHKIKLRRTGTVPYTVGSGNSQETVGFELAATVEKNKVAPPRRVATFGLFVQDSQKYGPLGIDRANEAFTMGTRLGVIETPSPGYYLPPGIEKKINGKDKVIALLREDEELLERVRTLMLERLSDQVADDVPELDPHAEQDGPLELDFATGAPPGSEVDPEALAQLQAANA
jgi:recombination protein RecA